MWRHALIVTPDSPFVSMSLGRDLARDGRFHAAARVFEEALRNHPHSKLLRAYLMKSQQLEDMTPRFRIPTPHPK
jgi:hypothetical protein